MTERVSPPSLRTPRSATFILLAALCLVPCAIARASDESERAESVQKLEAVEPLSSDLEGAVLRREIVPETDAPPSPFVMTLALEKPSSAVLEQNDLEGDYGDFSLEFLDEETLPLAEGRDLAVRRWRLYPRTGNATVLPPVPLTLKGADEQTFVVAAPECPLDPPDLSRGKNAGEIDYDLTPVQKISPLKIAALALCALLILLLAAWSKKRAVQAAERLVKTEPPYDRAVRRLDAIKNSKEYLENSPEAYVQIDDVLRRFLSEEFQIDAVEQTTQEILAGIQAGANQELPVLAVPEGAAIGSASELALDKEDLRKIAILVLNDPEILQELRASFESLDLIKFAGATTTFNDASRLYSSVREIVERSEAGFVDKTDAVRRELEVKIRRLAEQNAAAEQGADDAQTGAN